MVIQSAATGSRIRRIAYRRVPVVKYLAHPAAAGRLVRDLFGPTRAPSSDPTAHLRSAVEWLCRAQDLSPTADGGVSRSYHLTWDPVRALRGWMPSYPETTGYIIPTLLDYARAARDESILRRALRMADWECEVQMPEGAVQGGTVDETPAPCSFNTGQVLFGWVRAHRESGETRYLESAVRAARFLVGSQDPDGAWRRSRSRCVSTQVRDRVAAYTYETRTAWGLLEVWSATGEATFRAAAERNLEFARSRQRPNGWLAENCIHDPDRPLLHTIAYAAEGFLESGILLDREDQVLAAAKVADALLERQRTDGSLAGRFDSEWREAARWSCLTGDAQMAVVWLRLSRITGRPAYREAAIRTIRFLQAAQDLDSTEDGVRGAIAGSFPINGSYAPFAYPSWAAKFFVDAMLLEDPTSAGTTRGSVQRGAGASGRRP